MQIDADHWLDAARRVPSPFQNARPTAEVSLIVIHGISLPPGEFGGPYIDQLFTGGLQPEQHPYFAEVHRLEVSSHLLIRRDGELVQYVPFDRRAWHAGRSCYQGRDNCNDFSIGIELEGTDDVAYDPNQYRVLRQVLTVLWRHYPATRGAVVGHCHIAPGRKTDPGSSFDWDALPTAADKGEST